MKLKFFREQRKAILKAEEFVQQLPPDTQWMLSVTEQDKDACLNIWVQPGEVDDFRRVLGLSNYSYKATDCITYQVGDLFVSIIELGGENDREQPADSD
jgi:hypothetical protein